MADKEKKRNKPKKLMLRKVLYWLFWAGLVLAILAAGAAMAFYFHLAKDLPPIYSLRDYRPDIITEVYADDGTLIAEFSGPERRRIVSYEDLPEHLKLALIASEDHRFLDHRGVDWPGVLAALKDNIKAGKVERGASTISMGVAKTFFLERMLSISYKLKQAILALQIEKRHSKENILYLYLNQVDLGNGCQGVGEAAQYYFNKKVPELTLAESAMLIGVLPSPSGYNPIRNFKKAKERQKIVLNRMANPEMESSDWLYQLVKKIIGRDTEQKQAKGFITQEEADAAYAEPIKIYGKVGPRGEAAPYFTAHVRKLLVERYGWETVYHQGLKVFTTVNIKADKAAHVSVRERILGKGGIDEETGFRLNKIGKLAPEKIEEFLEKQEKEFRKQWVSERWRKALADGEGTTTSFDAIMAIAPDPVPLEAGETYPGVVENVDDKAREVIVRIGRSRGVIDKKGMGWVKQYLDKGDEGMEEFKFKNPSQILSQNDKVLVKVYEKIEQDGKFSYRLRLGQEPVIQGALFSMDVRTGHVKAMCGGLDYQESQFNRAVQAARQPGSAFKPIVYGAAFDAEPPGRFTPATIMVDTAIVFDPNTKKDLTPEEIKIWERYAPKNYDGKFRGEMTLREALAHSVNTIAVRLAWELGLRDVIKYAHSLGLTGKLDLLPCLPLGCSEITLDELSAAYNVYASGGHMVEPVYITRVYDRDGNLLEYEPIYIPGLEDSDTVSSDLGEGRPVEGEAGALEPGALEPGSSILDPGYEEEDIVEERPQPFYREKWHYTLSRPTAPQQLDEPTFEEYLEMIRSNDRDWLAGLSEPSHGPLVTSPQTAYLMNSMMKSVVTSGTGQRAVKLNRPVAGKTGTTNRYRDAMWIGYTPELIAGVWVGADDYAYSLGKGATGGSAALPIFVYYMEQTVMDRKPVDFQVPRGLQWAKIDKSDGLLYNEDCPDEENRIVEVFKKGTVPTETHPCQARTLPGDGLDDLRLLDRRPDTIPGTTISRPETPLP